MAIKGVLVWRNSDSTQDLNSKTGHIIRRSIFAGTSGGGQVTPSATDLRVTIAPFVAQGFDGLVVLNDAPVEVQLPGAAPGGVFWVVLFARYVLFGPPQLEFQVVPDSVLTTSLEAPYYIRFAKFTVPAAGVGTAALATIDYGAGDHSDQLGHTSWRGTVDTWTSLPLPPLFNGLPPNKDGDVRITMDDGKPWLWRESTQLWEIINNFGVLQSQAHRKEVLDKLDIRASKGTGIFAGAANNGVYADEAGALTLSDGPDLLRVHSTANGYSLRFAPFQAYVNGHKVLTRDETVVLPAPPGVATTRYDMVYLEVWRAEVAPPIGDVVYDNNQGGTSTLDEIDNLVENIIAADPGFGATNWNFADIQFIEGPPEVPRIIVTFTKFTVAEGIALTAPLNFPAMGVTSNVPGATTYGPATWNSRLGVTTTADTTVYKGAGWAIPLAVVKRSITEGAFFTPSVGHTSEDMSGATVMFVAPYADDAVTRKMIGPLVRDLAHKVAEEDDYPTGVLSGHKTPHTWVNGGDAGPTYFTTADTRWKLNFPTTTHQSSLVVDVPPVRVTLPDPPVTGVMRQMVWMFYWSSPHKISSLRPSVFGSYVVAAISNEYLGILEDSERGTTGLWANAVMVASDVGTAIDEEEAFANLSFDVMGTSTTFTAVAGEPGVYEADSLSPEWQVEHSTDARMFAVPLALIHRRNSTLWAVGATITSNFNGSSVGGNQRPEQEYGNLSCHPYDLLAREVIDLRHLTGDIPMDEIRSETMSQLKSGRLATGFTRNPMTPHFGSPAATARDVAGTTHLMRDTLGNISAEYPNKTVADSGLLDGVRHSWSDAVEIQTVSWTTDLITAPVSPGGSTAFTKIFSSDGLIDGIADPVALDVVQQVPLVNELGEPIFEVQYIRVGGIPLTQLIIRAPRGAYIHSGSGLFHPNSDVGSLVLPPVGDKHTFGLVNFTHLHHGGFTPAPGPNPQTVYSRSVTPGPSGGGADQDTRISYDYLSNGFTPTVATSVGDVDTVGRPRTVALGWETYDDPGDGVALLTTASSGPASIQVSCMFVYDKPKTANKASTELVNYGATPDLRITGLSLPPQKVYNIQGTVRGQPYADMSVGPIYAEVPITLAAAATAVDITTTDLAAVIGEPAGDIKIYGILGEPTLGFSGPVPDVEALAVETADGGVMPTSRLVVHFDASIAAGTVVTFKVAYVSDKNKYWFEVYKTSRAIHGPFTWMVDDMAQIDDAGFDVNANTGEEGRWKTLGVSHPMTDPNKFTLGAPGHMQSFPNPFSLMVSKQNSPFGFFHRSASFTTSYVTTNRFFYSGVGVTPYPTPYATGVAGMGRWNSDTTTFNGDINSGPGWSNMFWDTNGVGSIHGTASQTGCEGTTLVYAVAVPLTNVSADQVTITYEAAAYQGIMGDNEDLTTRLNRVRDAVVPSTVGETLRYESVSDLFVTTAGTGLPRMGINDVSLASSFFAGGGTSGFRGAFFDPVNMIKNSVSPDQKNRLLNSERLRVNPASDYLSANWRTPDDDLDLVMHFVPAPPSQFNIDNLFGTYNLGQGPGSMSDFEHNALTHNMLSGASATPNQFWKNEGYNSSSSLITVNTTKGRVFSRFFVKSLTGGVDAEPDQLDNHTGWTNSDSSTFSGGEVIDPKPGLELTRLASDSTLTTIRNRQIANLQFYPEHVGAPFVDALGLSVSQGTRGWSTLRQPVKLANEFLNLWPSENLLQPSGVDIAYKPSATSQTEFLDEAEIQPTLLSQSSSPVMHQAAGAPSLANAGIFFDQPIPDVFPTITATDISLSLQKVWAFRGSVVNNAGRCWLLVNAGYGSRVIRDHNLFSLGSFNNVNPNTGCSADVYHLLYRPVKRK